MAKTKKRRKPANYRSLRDEYDDTAARHLAEVLAGDTRKKEMADLQVKLERAQAKSKNVIKALEVTIENLKTLFD